VPSVQSEDEVGCRIELLVSQNSGRSLIFTKLMMLFAGVFTNNEVDNN
jgi:hypothetical protein